VVLLLVGVFALLPSMRLLVEIATSLAGPQRSAVLATLGSPDTWRATRHSLEVGIGGTALAVLYGAIFACLVSLTPVRARHWLVFGFVVQALLPPQVVALAWLQMWLPLRGQIAAAGFDAVMSVGNPLQSRGGIIALLGLHYAPLVFLTLRAGLLNLPPEVLEAARVSGATPWRALWRVILPLLAPALSAGAALAFVSSIGNFGIPAFLGIPANYLVLPTLIYRELSGFGPSAMPAALTLSVLVALLAVAGVWVQRLSLRGGHYRVMAERRLQAPFDLGCWQGPVALAAHGLVWLLLLAPMAALMGKSLSPALGVALSWDNLSLEHYAYVLIGNDATLRALRNSVSMSLAAAGVLAAISVVLAYQLEYRRSVWVRRLLPAVEFPYVIPGVVLAIAMILLYLPPLPLVGGTLFNTLWIIFLAYLARFLTIQLRPVMSGFMQMPHEMLEAAEVCGASFGRRLRRVIVPLILPSVTAGAMLVFLLAMNELTVSALLWATGTETLGVVVFSLEQGGESAAASALGVVSITATLLAMAVASWWGRQLPEGVLPWRA
jgi:iron(III) transport system permease protein